MKNLSKIKTGDAALDFALSDTEGEEWKLSGKIGRVVALLFYPGNETLVCTKQLCSVRDNWRNYLDTGAEVVGVSPGTPDEHRQFAEHHNLPLTLLADANRSVTNIYGKHFWMPIWATRAVVVIDAKGIVRYQNVIVRALRPSDDEVLAAIHLAKYDALAGRRAEFSVKLI
ncbi:MAG: peroxiredoxin [Pyrinomonadaceae bacterium]